MAHPEDEARRLFGFLQLPLTEETSKFLRSHAPSGTERQHTGGADGDQKVAEGKGTEDRGNEGEDQGRGIAAGDPGRQGGSSERQSRPVEDRVNGTQRTALNDRYVTKRSPSYRYTYAT